MNARTGISGARHATRDARQATRPTGGRRRAMGAAVFSMLFASLSAAASILMPVTTIVREVVSPVRKGTVKVPWKAPCPSYGEWFSLAEKQKVYRMAQLAKWSYLEVGKAYEPGEWRHLPGENDVVLGDDLTEGLRVEDFLGAGSDFFEVEGDGTITVPGGSGFQAELYLDPQTGNLTLAFRGSESSELADWGTDALQAMGSDTTQYEAAARLLACVMDGYKGHIDVTGHSLGGGLAQYAMAANDLQGRVDGYTFNSAGLSRETLAKLSQRGIDDAGAHLSNVRVEGDIVSFAESHIGNIFDVPKAPGTGNEHFIDTMLASLDKFKETDGPGRAAAPLCGTGEYADPDFVGDFAGWFGEGLSAFLPSEVSGALSAALEDYIRSAALASAFQAAGRIDAKVSEFLARVEAMKRDLMAKLPDDKSRAAVDAMLSDIARGDWNAAEESGRAAVHAIIDPNLDQVLKDAGVGEKDRAQIVGAAHEALDTWMQGGNVGENVFGNVESFIFDKLRRELGEQAAESWKNAWTTLRAGEDAWEQFGKAVFDSFEFVGMRELQQALDRAFRSVEKHCPWLSKFLKDSGINSESVFALAQNVWGVVKGDGTLAQKLEEISETVAKQLYEWFSNFVAALTDMAVRAALALVDWLSSQLGKLIAGLDAKLGELLDGGTHAKFASMLKFSDAAKEERGDTSVLVVDYSTGEGVDLGPAASDGAANMEVLHDEAF